MNKKRIIAISVISIIVISSAIAYFVVRKKNSSSIINTSNKESKLMKEFADDTVPTQDLTNNLDLSDLDAVNARVNNNFIDAGIAITFAIPSNWKADSLNVFSVKNFNEEYNNLEKNQHGGHQPWRLEPLNAAGACLWNFGIKDNNSDIISFSKKLIEVKKDEIYALEIGARKLSVHLKIQTDIPIAYKLEIESNEAGSSQDAKATDEPADAEKILVDFFTYLNHKDYNKAVDLLTIPEKASQECPLDADEFDGCGNYSWEGLESFSRQEERNNKAKVLENCAHTTKEATLKPNIIGIQKYSEGKYIFTVQFFKNDGSILVEGPCCGATEEQMPSLDKFEYKVKKIDGIFKVITPPVSRP